MKTCPVCNREYTDETYSYCLDDGALLSTDSNDSQATIEIPKAFDNLPPTVYVPPSLVPTRQFQPEEMSQSGIINSLLSYLTDNRQTFGTLGRFRYNNEYIWTNGHFFEIAESIPTVLRDLFPLKESSNPVELIKSLQTQLAGKYTKVQSIAASTKEELTDLTGTNHTVHVNSIYYQYLQMRYPQAAVMLGASVYDPALFVLGGVLRAGIMGVRL